MDQQNPSSHSLISSNLAAAAAGFNPQLAAGLNNASNNVGQNPLFMSTLQHLGFNTNAASNLLQTPQISLNGQFSTSDLSNAWNNQPSSSWFEQAKVAAMYNSMLQSTVNDHHAQAQLESMVEQSLKAAAAAAAVRGAPASMSSAAALNLATQQANVNAFTNATMPIMAAAVAAAAANPLSSISNSFFTSAVDNSQSAATAPSMHHQNNNIINNFHPNVTSVSATFVIPSTSNSISLPSATSFQDAYDIPKTSSAYNNYFNHSDIIPSTSSQIFNNSFTPKPLPTDIFNVSAMISDQQQNAKSTTSNNDIFYSSALQSTSAANHMPISQNSFQLQSSSTSNTLKESLDNNIPITASQILNNSIPFDDLSMFDFNDLEMFGTKHNNTIPNADIYPSTSSVIENNIKATIEDAPKNNYSVDALQQSSSSKIFSNVSREIDTDKELDRWLSLAVGGNLPPDDEVHGSPLSAFEEVANDHVDLFPTQATGFSLDPVMFTPPDSPSPEPPREKSPVDPTSTNTMAPAVAGPSRVNSVIYSRESREESLQPPPSIVESLVFMPKPKENTLNDRVPVYKQKKSIFSSASTLEKALDKVSKSRKADEYSFTDDDEEVPLSKSSALDLFGDDGKNAEDTMDSETQHSQSNETSEIVSKKKSFIESKPLTTIEEIPEDKPKERNNIAEIIRKRKQKLAEFAHVFLYTEILDGDDVVRPMSKIQITDEEEKSDEAHGISESDSEPMNVDEEEHSPLTIMPILCEASPSTNSQEAQVKNEVSDNFVYPNLTEAGDDEIIIKEEIRESDRILPKLVIKIRRESVTSPISKKKKKKHKKKRHDTDWEPSEKKKKKHKSKHRHHESRKSEDLSEVFNNGIIDEDIKLEVSMTNGFPSTSSSSSVFNDPSVIQRLSCFGNATGDLPKGTFVVCKQDILKDDCPLWKVDNQNLLQKYPLIPENKSKVKHYKNSSTYSGWCDQVATSYLFVQVKYHKQSRAETIVEPQIPLVDLLPAVSESFSGDNESFGLKIEPIFEDIFEPLPPHTINTITTKSTVRSHMQAFTKAMLHHAASLTFLQKVKNSNDWDYLCALNEVENMTSLGKQKINDRVQWGQRFEVMLTIYSNAFISTDYDEDDEVCQACGNKIASKYLNLYSNESYDYDSLEIQTLPDIDGESPLVAIQFYVCSRCANLAQIYHRLHHMRYATFRYCEDMIENMSLLRPDLPLDALITLCLSKRSWQRKLINEYALLWRKVQENEL